MDKEVVKGIHMITKNSTWYADAEYSIGPTSACVRATIRSWERFAMDGYRLEVTIFVGNTGAFLFRKNTKTFEGAFLLAEKWVDGADGVWSEGVVHAYNDERRAACSG